MSFSSKIKVYFFQCCLFSLSALYAQTNTHFYDVATGLVEYEIFGGTRLTNETNLSIKGTSVLHFKKWGDLKLEEDEGIVLTSGAIHSLQQIKRLEKHTEETIIIVDFENTQLLKRKKGKSIASQAKETKGLKQQGEEVVAGHLCKIWVGPSITKCIYKGIVLKQESTVLGVSYSKIAKKAVFDITISHEKCLLPNYPVHAFSLYKDTFKTKSLTSSQDICEVFKDVENEVDVKSRSYDSVISMDDKRRKKFVNKIAEGIFKSQKKILPKIFLAMKKSRECLHLSEDSITLQKCIDTFEAKKEDLEIIDGDYAIFNDADNKEQMLDKIEDAIIDLQARMPCVKRSENITDLSHCMK